jgi:hypothetical protein
MDSDERARWGVPEPFYTGDADVDLHNGKGTKWVHQPDGQKYPDCPCHLPREIAESRRAETAKREAAERQLAAMHHRPYVPPVDDEPPERRAGATCPEPVAPPEPPRRFGFLLRRRP